MTHPSSQSDRLGNRLWLAWRVMRGFVASVSWDYGSDTVTIEFSDRRAIQRKWIA